MATYSSLWAVASKSLNEIVPLTVLSPEFINSLKEKDLIIDSEYDILVHYKVMAFIFCYDSLLFITVNPL